MPLKTADGFRDFFVFGLEMVYYALVSLGDKFFAADNAGVGEIASAVHEMSGVAEFKILISFLCGDLGIDLSALAFIHGAGFIDKTPVSAKTFRWVHFTESL